MTLAAVKKYDGILYGDFVNGTNSSSNYLDPDPEVARTKITMTLALCVGVIHILLSILHVGVVTKYLSDAIVNGFTCGAAYQTVTSQIPTMLGIKLGDLKIPFVIIGVRGGFFLLYLVDFGYE